MIIPIYIRVENDDLLPAISFFRTNGRLHELSVIRHIRANERFAIPVYSLISLLHYADLL